ncbi:DUF4910 domain-containing protein (plasmid) [Paroceanicella profunda]|uniref:DUF4910 domain-containing protein n=1 Tax=Paroceanicella profunda TaxID=2579971 RepID=A0A5B8G0R3_9RHOB|nr:DUF4910 domain-containing protein [Paroceanicella profunda]QDL94706.1 DUF4910 domain-containing protein [Paroceanicella profunda]
MLDRETAREAAGDTGGAAGRFDLHGFCRTLYPIARSITGPGVRETLGHVARHVPLEIHEVASGTPVLDWHVPEEWSIRAATIRSLSGEVLVDFAAHSLHVMGYSVPVSGVFSRAALAAHVHTLPERPGIIPYRTGYYARDWGFCMAHETWERMRDAEYRVEIDSTLAPGSLTWGEAFFPGEEAGEVLVSAHVCHPSLANDNLSGIAVATALGIAARAAQERGERRRLGLRLLFVPATIGTIAWLAQNEARLGAIRAGLVLTCLGDAGPFHYKRSRQGTALVDRAVAHVLGGGEAAHALLPFTPDGYDERQYCSPGFDLPVGCLMRGVHGRFPEYHTSEDNCDFITQGALEQSLATTQAVIDVIDGDVTFLRTDGRGEPQLGRRGLYRAISGQTTSAAASQMDLMWFLNLADGAHSLLEMAERAGVPFARLQAAARLAQAAGLVGRVAVSDAIIADTPLGAKDFPHA